MTLQRAALLLALVALSFICMSSGAGLAQKKPEPVDCVIYMQYQPDLGSEKTAYNKGIKASAEALAGKTGALISEVNKKNKFEGVFLGIVKENKCCKTLNIVGHGNPDGSLQLPYENPGAGELKDHDKENAGATTVAGPKAKSGQGAEWLSYFVTTIEGQKGDKSLPKDNPGHKAIPPVLCPEPEKAEDRPTVPLHTCWSGIPEDGVAGQVAKKGVQTEGWTGSCKFPIDEKTGKGQPPRAGTGAEDSGAKLEKFEPPKTKTGGGGTKSAEKKKHPKKSVRYFERISTGHPFSETVLITGTDGETWCTYGDGVEFETVMIVTDENGNEVETTEVEEAATETETSTVIETGTETSESDAETGSESVQSETHGSVSVSEATPTVAETAPEQPPVTPETPPTTENVPEEPITPETPPTTDNVPEELTTPETPVTTEKVPEEPTSEIPDTIFVKAKEEVLEGQPPRSPIENQVVKLFPKEEPGLPGEGVTQEAQDTGFDKDPVECTTGADGACTMQIPPEERAFYEPPGTKESSDRYYRVDYDLPETSGGVAETTGKDADSGLDEEIPDGATVTYEEFTIGDRSFVRLVYEKPYGVEHDFEEQFKPVFGESYEEDYCRDKQPGPPLGMQPRAFGALNHDLPEATVTLGGAMQTPGSAPR